MSTQVVSRETQLAALAPPRVVQTRRSRIGLGRWPEMTLAPRYTWAENSTLQCDREALALVRKLIAERTVAACGTNEFSALCHTAAVLAQRVEQGEQASRVQS